MDVYVKRQHAATELAKGLRLNLFMKGPFDPVEDYTVHEITLGLVAMFLVMPEPR